MTRGGPGSGASIERCPDPDGAVPTSTSLAVLHRPSATSMNTAPHLLVEAVHDEFVVTLPGSRYAVTYYKPDKSPQLMARNISTKDDAAAAIMASEFLQAAWWLANNKARALGWIA